MRNFLWEYACWSLTKSRLASDFVTLEIWTERGPGAEITRRPFGPSLERLRTGEFVSAIGVHYRVAPDKKCDLS